MKAKSKSPARKTRQSKAIPRSSAAEHIEPNSDVMKTLRARARKLAKPRVTAAATPHMRVVTFTWRNQSWAVDGDLIDEVIPVSAITPLPGLARTHLGLIHYRGEVYPLVDIGTLFDVANGAQQKPTHALLVKCDTGAIAIAATGLEGASPVEADTISEMASDDASHPALRGLTPSLAVLFDPVQLLDDSRMVVDEQPSTVTTLESNA